MSVWSTLADCLSYALQHNALQFIAIICFIPILSFAKDNELLLVTNNDQPIHQRFVHQLKIHLKTSGSDKIHIKVISLDTWRIELTNQYPLTLALGNAATKKLTQRKSKSHILFSLIPKSTYQKIIQHSNGCQPENCSAIYLDQPIERTFALTRLAFPHMQTLGLLTSSYSSYQQSELSKLASKYGFALKRQYVSDRSNLVFSLNKIMRESDALLSLPDPSIYTRHTVQNILLTAYQYRKPVIGYSNAFVRAGALLAVYSDLPQLSQQTAEEIQRFFKQDSALPKTQFPRYFSVSVNNMVARSLGIKIDSQLNLQKKLGALNYE